MSSDTECQAIAVRHVRQRPRIAAIRLLAVASVGLILVSDPHWDRASAIGSAMTAIGQGLVIVAVIGRLWATLYIGGRKNTCLVTAGPYSVTRNPLYVGSILGTAGIGLMFCSVLLAAAMAGAVTVLLSGTARAEATVLRHLFGASYDAYAKRVPLLWPRWSLYRDAELDACQPGALHRALRRALGDGLLFLLAIPAAELVDHAKTTGLLPQVIGLY